MQIANEGDLIFAIPGTVDYMIPLTPDATIFNDFSVPVSQFRVMELNKYIYPMMQRLKNSDVIAVLAIVESKIKERIGATPPLQAGYTAVNVNGMPQLVKVDQKAKNIEWIGKITNPDHILQGRSFHELYRTLVSQEGVPDETAIDEFVGRVLNAPRTSKAGTIDIYTPPTEAALPLLVVKVRELIKHLKSGLAVRLSALLKEYPWGRKVGSTTDGEENEILRMMGAKSPIEEVKIAEANGIPAIAGKTRIGERWTGKGAPSQLATAFAATSVFNPTHLAERGSESGITGKILQADSDLSWQIHLGFAEMVTALADTYVYVGLKTNLTKARFKQLVREGRIDEKGETELFHRVLLKAGESLIVPPKCPHAYLKGSVVTEIKDIELDSPAETYSFFDRGRLTAAEREQVTNAVVNNEPIPAETLSKIRPGKDALTLSPEALETIARHIEEAGYLKALDLSKVIFTPVVVSDRETAEKARVELTGVTESVGLKYTINENETIEADLFSLGSGVPLTVLEGEVEIVTEKGKEKVTLKQGEELLIPNEAGKYTLKAINGKAVVVTQYAPSELESIMYTGYEVRMNEVLGMQRNAQKLPGKKYDQPLVHLLVSKKAFFAEGPGSFQHERALLKNRSGEGIDMDFIDSAKDDVKILKENLLKNLGGKDKERVKYVVQLTKDEWNLLKGLNESELKEVTTALAGARIMVLPSLPKGRPNGLPFIREIEAGGIRLGLTDFKKVSEDPTCSDALALKAMMARLTGNRNIDTKMLMDLFVTAGAPELPTAFADRIQRLIRGLLITVPARAYETDKELKGRRELLWAV